MDSPSVSSTAMSTASSEVPVMKPSTRMALDCHGRPAVASPPMIGRATRFARYYRLP
jgi:hypothetical protein